jgi:WD40 repeat protein
LDDNTVQKDILQLHFPLPDFGPTSWTFASPAFSSDGKMVVSQTQDENGYALTVWEVRDDLRLIPLVRNICGYTLNGFTYGFSKDGKYLFSVSIIQRIITFPDDTRQCAPHCNITITYKPINNGVYQMPEGNPISELEITTTEANYYRNMFYPDNSYLATIYSKYDSNRIIWIDVQLWQVSDGTLYRKLDSMQLDENQGEDANLAFSPTGDDLAFIGGGKLQVWQWQPNTFRWTVDGIFSTLAYSPDGSLIATGAPDGSIRLWRASDGVELATLSAKDHPISYVAFSPDGSLLVTLDASGMLMLWSVSQ